MAAGVRRIVLLTLGWEDLPKSVSVEGAPDSERLREPVPAVLLECDGGWLLLDTGFNAALVTDPALRRRFHGDPVIQPVLPGPGEPLEEALAGAGVDLADIAAVAVSHLHNDHAGGLKHFAGRVPVHIQRAELDYGMSAPPAPEDNGIFRVDFDDPRFDAADLTENVEREVAVGGRIGAGPEVSIAQIRKLKRIAADRGYRLVPGHDPVVWPALTAELARG
ncbi:MAG TPA: MBL fold metallo-hydrolase [Streptosporangiaceae bacterium]|nr:MBL fold metallo-hydrolase [Streptosporangiaceae bacterium]